MKAGCWVSRASLPCGSRWGWASADPDLGLSPPTSQEFHHPLSKPTFEHHCPADPTARAQMSAFLNCSFGRVVRLVQRSPSNLVKCGLFCLFQVVGGLDIHKKMVVDV